MRRKQKPSYAELEQRCQSAEAMLAAIRSGQTDSILSDKGILVLRLAETERALRSSEEKYRSLIESQEAAIAIVDSEGVVHFINAIGAASFGQPPDVAGKKLHDFFPKAVADWQLGQVRQVIATGQGVAAEYQSQLAGQPNWQRVSIQPICSEGRPGDLATVNSVDITERKLADEALKDAHQRLEQALKFTLAVISAIPIPLFYKDREGRYLGVNDAFADLMGFTPEYYRGKTVMELWPDEFAAVYYQKDLELMENPVKQVYEFNVLDNNHAVRQAVWSKNVFRDENGQVAGIVGAFQDITERKQSEKALQVALVKYKTLFETFPLGITIADAAGNIIECNPMAETLLGVCVEEYTRRQISSTLWRIVRPDGTPMPAEEFASVRALNEGRKVENVEMGLVKPDSTITWINVTAAPLPLEGHGVVVTYGDISKRRQIEQNLHENRLRMEMALKGANVGTWDWNVQTGEAVFNERWAEIVGYTLDELQPISIQTWRDLCDPDDLKDSNELLQRHFAGEVEFYECEVRLRHKAGSWVWVIDRGRVLEWDADGKPLRMFGTHFDITDIKRAERFTEARLRLANLSYQIQDLEVFIRAMLDEVEALTESQIAFFHFVDNDQNTINLQAWSTNTLETLCAAEGRGQHYPVAEAGVWAECIRDGQPHIYNDYASLPNRRGLPEGHAPVTRLISLPLKHNGLIVAALGAGNKPQDYDEADIEIVRRLAEETFDAILRQRAEENLRLSEEKYRLLSEALEERVKQRTAQVQDLYENAPTGYHSLDAEGRFLQINQTELKWLGYSREEVLGRPFSYFLTPESLAVFQTTFPIFKQRGWGRDLEFDFVRKDGSVLPALLNTAAIFDANGQYLSSRSTIFDNTERKKAQEALRESEAQNRLLFDAAPEAVALFDDSGRLVRHNHAFELLTGYREEELFARTLDELALLPREQIIQIAAAILQAVRANTPLSTTEFTIQRADGEQCDVSVRVFALPIQGRQHFLTTLSDITTHKQAADALRLANLEMTQAMRMKDDFLANMSHELRTPLTGILGMTESMLLEVGGPITERQKKYLNSIDASGHHLLTLINDILDLSKIEVGKVELEPELVYVGDICQASLAFVRETAIKKHINLQWQCESAQISLVADARRLKQILVNLLSNAVKFTPTYGQVGLYVRADTQNSTIYFSVTDTGIGIAPEDMANLFKPFTQVDSSLSRQHEGTGLGLALVRRLIELHDGTVQVESELGHGSRFTIAMPWKHSIETRRPTAAQTPEPSPSSQPATFYATKALKRILLAEDNDVNAEITQDYLTSKGYEVFRAQNGHEIIPLAMQVHPDLVLMDIQMPGLDGLEATRQFRQIPQFKNTPILALTALAMKGDRERCLKAGANEYLAKPFSLSALVQIVAMLLNEEL